MNPSHDATHACSICEEPIRFERYDGKAQPPFPQGWTMYVAHDHELTPPLWRSIMFYREKGQRFPPEAKAIAQKQQDNRKAAMTSKKLVKDSGGKDKAHG